MAIGLGGSGKRMAHPTRPIWKRALAAATTAGLLATVVMFSPPFGLAAGQPSQSLTTLELVESTPIPPRDPISLYARLRGIDPASVALVVNDTIPNYEAGRVDEFWIGNQFTREYRLSPAVLRHVSEHAYWYVEQGRSVSDGALVQSAEFFEQRTYPTVRRYFGTEWFPGIDNDPRITILIARVPGVGAYFSSGDEYPVEVYKHSNQREMVHMNLDSIIPGTQSFDGVLAHEFQHMVHFYGNPNDETWVDEGSSELATNLVMEGQPLSAASYQAQPDTQLTGWSDLSGGVSAHYDGAYLFMRYFVDRYGGPEILYDVIAQPARGDELFDRYLESTGRTERFPEVFGDWAVANFLDDPAVDGARYSQPSVDLHPRISATLRVDDLPLDAQVHQFGVDYVELVGQGDVNLTFSGSPEVRLAGADPASGSFVWWSNRADGMDSTLTRELDLTGVPAATLQFRTWYEIEQDYDYLYVMASADGGQTWVTLPGTSTTSENPTGNSLGDGYTHSSGGGDVGQWVDEQIDLSAFAGKTILLRFEYVTDQAFNESGALLDDVRVPEIGFSDDAEQDAGWTAVGFIRSDNRIPQSYQLRLITYSPQGNQVQSLAVDDAASATATISDLGGATTRAVLVIAATAPRTLEEATYRVELSP